MTRRELSIKHSTLYNWLLRNDRVSLDKYFPTTIKSWPKSACKKDALNYNYRTEWKNNNPSSYRSAYKNGWLDECCGHMTYMRGKSNRRKVINIDTSQIFDSSTAASKYIGLNRGAVKNAIRQNVKAGGYRWEYLDD